MSQIKTLTLAVCLFDGVTALDYQGPLELIGFLHPTMAAQFGAKYGIEVTYLSPRDEPVKPSAGPLMVASKTYDDVEKDQQFDLLLIPGGPDTATSPNAAPQSLIRFLQRQAPKATYVLSVCTGSWILAQAGLLNGKKATTNKAMFKMIKNATADANVEWVAKARWIVDGNVWTSSGITAGIDMASAFLNHLVGVPVTDNVRAIAEVSVHQQEDDEFAVVHGLVEA